MLKRLLGCLIMPLATVGVLGWTTICLPILLFMVIETAIETYIEDKTLIGFLMIIPMWLIALASQLYDEIETLRKIALYFFKDEEINFDDISE